MGKNKKKLLVIGIDQAIPYLLQKFLKENKLPNIQNLVDNGVHGEGYSCPPCDTPTNWTTIATGATAANHGVTSFYMHIPGEPLDLGMKYRSRTQLYKYCKAQYLWGLADKHGYKPFVYNYPSGWPSEFRNGVMSLFTWNIPNSLPKMLISSEIFTIDINSDIQLKEGAITKAVINNIKSLTQNLDLTLKNHNHIKLILNMSNPHKQIYDSLKLSANDSNETKIIKECEWSQWISININSENGILPSIFRIKPLKIDPNGKSIKLERSGIYNTKGWSVPDSFGEKLVKYVFEYDLPKKREVDFMLYGSMKRYLKSARRESLSLVQALQFGKSDFNWDFCFFHYHPLDTINHDLLAYLHKDSRVYTEKKAEKAWQNVETAYRIVDEMVGELIKTCIDKDTITLFISDHGAIPIWKVGNITKILVEAGLITYEFRQTKKKYFINWKKSMAFPYMEPPFIWVNLKERDPQGIVEQKDYEMVREKIIEALYEARDPETHEKIIEMALKREDARDLGLNGDRIGDVVYFLKPPYGVFDGDLDALDASYLSSKEFNKPITYNSKRFFGAHAYYLPSTQFGDYSVSVPIIISGPEIKEGFKLKDHVNLIDIVPTLSHMLNIPAPKNSEGRILYEMIQ